MLFNRYLRADRSRRTTTEQILKSRAHFGLWQMNPIAVSGQYPFKRIVEKFPDGLDQGPFSPNETGRSFQRLGMGIPPEMITGEKKSLTVQQGHASRCMARYGNDLEL